MNSKPEMCRGDGTEARLRLLVSFGACLAERARRFARSSLLSVLWAAVETDGLLGR